MRPLASIIALAAFFTAAALALAVAVVAASVVENRSAAVVQQDLAAAGLPWAEVSVDGLAVTLSGTAPTEAMRFRARTVAGAVVGAGRVKDDMTVTPALALTAPRFSLELLRNDDGISLIGLVPSSWDQAGRIAEMAALAGEDDVTDMLESADFPIPPGWDRAVDFGLVALRMLPRSKISIDAARVQVTAISDSLAQRQRFETELLRAVPAGLEVSFDISAPRPVITPFTLRLVIDEEGARFDACAADTDRARARILSAAMAAGVQGRQDCTIGLGAPSPRWAEAAVVMIGALAELGAGSVTLSDVDISLIAADTVPQDLFDRVAGELSHRLPDVFSLRATLTEAPQERRDQGPPQFTATLDDNGAVQLRGRLTDTLQRATVDAFARARFGADAVFTATRLDPDLPTGWTMRVLAALSALAELHEGAVLVQADRVEIRGRSGSDEARAAISGILSERLGQGAAFRVDVAYDESLDPASALPQPEECERRARAVLAGGKITFAPGSAQIDPTARRVLGDLADVLRDCGMVRMEIGGHTDSQGRAETNLALSQRRAESVVQALRGLRVPVSNLTARGYGAAEPVADNATEEGREANRRIAIRLSRPGGGSAAADAGDDGAPQGTAATAPEQATPMAIDPGIRPRARPEDLVEEELAEGEDDDWYDDGEEVTPEDADAEAEDQAGDGVDGADDGQATGGDGGDRLAIGTAAGDEEADGAAPDAAAQAPGDGGEGQADAARDGMPGDDAAAGPDATAAADADGDAGPAEDAGPDDGRGDDPGDDPATGEDDAPFVSAAPAEPTVRPVRRPADR